MYKKILCSTLLLFILFFMTACNKPKSIILFNRYPITKENLLNNATEFPTDKRIYYIFMSQKPLKTNLVRIKIYKRLDKLNYKVTNVVYCNDFKVYKDQIYYYNDYIVLHEPGYYYMAIFAINAMDKPLATADFQVN